MEPELTLEQLKDMKPDSIIAKGHTADIRLSFVLELKWVAVRGEIHDWAIYYAPSDWDYDLVQYTGDKVVNEDVIKELVPCTEEAFQMYRY